LRPIQEERNAKSYIQGEGKNMKQKRLLAISILAAAWLAFGTGWVWAQATGGPSGTSKSEPQSDKDVKAPPSGQSQPSPGLSQSQKEGGTSKTSKTESQSDTDISKGSAGQPGGMPSGRASGSQSGQGMSSSQEKSASGMGGKGAGQQWAMEDVKQAQEALKSKGHDPGPIDGKMGPQTRQALKAFQSSNNLKETGTLDADTAKKLGIDKGGSAAGAPSSGASSERGGSSSVGRESGGAGKGQSSSTQREPSSPSPSTK
jgi:Putative peptidoglycan binding domain